MMNLTSYYIMRVHNKIKKAEASSKEYARGGHGNPRLLSFGGDIQVSIGGTVIGQVNSLSVNVEMEREDRRPIRMLGRP